MIEILFLIWLYRKLGQAATDKGRSSSWAALGPVLWIVGEITGAVLAASSSPGGGWYLGALVGAALGGALAYVIVGQLSPGGITARVVADTSRP